MNIRIRDSISLPSELLMYIAEFAAASDMSTAFNLCLVSRAFKSYVTPVLYTSISLPAKEYIQRFISGVESAQSNSVDPTRHTRRLYIEGYAMYYHDWTLSLLRNSPLEHILLCPEETAEEDVVEGAELWPRPWHVMISYVRVSWFKHRIVLFAQTTHLYLEHGTDPEVVNLCTNLPLTHIGMAVWGDFYDQEDLFAAIDSFLSMRSIEIVSIHALLHRTPMTNFEGEIWRTLADNADKRLIVMPGLDRDQLVEEFESGKSVWDRVDDFRNWRETV